MFCIIYNKASKHIAHSRHDTSTPAPQPASYWFSVFLEDHNSSANDYACVEIPYVKGREIIFGRDKWNETTQQIEADPNWVPPAPEPEPEPTPTPTPTV